VTWDFQRKGSGYGVRFRFQVSGYDDTGAISSAKVRERKKKA
jgi:hypothetical protein